MVMLVSETKDYEKYLDDKDWLGEIKRDGNRITLDYDRQRDKSIIFYNRKNEEYSKNFPQELLDELKEALDGDDYINKCIIDGELTYTDIKGIDHRTQAQCPDAEPVLWIWDIQELNDENLRDLTWAARKKELHTVCEVYEFFYRGMSNIRFVPHYAQKRELLELAEKNDMEGIVLKNVHAKYVEGKVKTQYKVKFVKTDDYIVVGYTNASEKSINSKGKEIKNKRFPYFKALLLAQYDKDGKLISKGQVGGGFKDVDLKKVTPMLFKNKSRPVYDLKSPHGFTDKDFGQAKDRCVWLNKNDWFIVEIKMQNLTEYGNPFQPRFLKIRNDKKQTECIYNEN